MVEHTVCPACRHGNPPENRFCGRCGASLTNGEQLVPRREGDLSKEGRALPARFGPVGKTLAVGLAALVAEAGLLWLRHRAGRAGRPRVRGTGSSTPERLVGRGFEEVLVWVQEGDLRRRGFARRTVRAFGVAEPDDG